MRGPASSVVQGVLFVPAATSTSCLLDAMGRKVMVLRAGANDITRLRPGVYFFRERLSVGGEWSAVSVRKVIVTR